MKTQKNSSKSNDKSAIKVAAKIVETVVTYTPEQRTHWLDELGKVAGRARTNCKMLEQKVERIEKGVDKEALHAKVVELASAGKMAEMIPIARELENADTLLDSLHERANEYRTKYNEAMQMLSITVSALEFEVDKDFNPDKYMLKNFPSEAQLAAAMEQSKIEEAEKEAHDLNIIFDQKAASLALEEQPIEAEPITIEKEKNIEQ